MGVIVDTGRSTLIPKKWIGKRVKDYNIIFTKSRVAVLI